MQTETAQPLPPYFFSRPSLGVRPGMILSRQWKSSFRVVSDLRPALDRAAGALGAISQRHVDVTIMAQRPQVGRISEAAASMPGCDVVDLGGLDLLTGLRAHRTPWLASQLLLAGAAAGPVLPAELAHAPRCGAANTCRRQHVDGGRRELGQSATLGQDSCRDLSGHCSMPPRSRSASSLAFSRMMRAAFSITSGSSTAGLQLM